jgi:hypothetical protein
MRKPLDYVVPVRTNQTRSGSGLAVAVRRLRDVFGVWPGRRSTAGALFALIVLQSSLFFTLTQRSFFFHDDFNYFMLAQERHLLHYLLTPILGVYPAPGDRLASFLLQRVAPMNFAVARTFLLIVLAGTTILLWQLVRTLARSDRWWTVVLVVPFALSLTLVLPIAWWSAGLPIVPALFFTAVALSAWLRSYEDPAPTFWVGMAVVAVAAAGAFYMKFLLIPVYLLLVRLMIVPRLMEVPGGIRSLWQERMRWIALAVPPAAFLAVFVLSGLAGSSAVEGSRPFLEYFTTAWFRAFIPASFLNARLDGSTPSVSAWFLVLGGQVLFWGVVLATWWRSSLALRGWALLGAVFALNAATVGAVRLAAFGVDEIAYALRYYPEATLFLPLALALGLRQGAERRPGLAWEGTSYGRIAIASTIFLYVGGLLVWAPGIVSDSAGVSARSWYENLRSDLDAVTIDGAVPRIVDSETPAYVMEDWMAPDNRVSTVVDLLPLDVVFNGLNEPTFLVREDGHLAGATFRPILEIVSGTTLANGVRVEGEGRSGPAATCLNDGGRLLYQPEADVTGERLTMRVAYAGRGDGTVALTVDVHDPDRPFRYLALRPSQSEAELVDLGTSRLRALTLEPSPADEVCIARLEIGILTQGGA